jgi:hypothetical protein
MRWAPRIAALATAVLVCGCGGPLARTSASACRPGEQRMQRDALYFGSARPAGGTVSDTDWQTFEREVLTPSFPPGFSAIDASGHWRGADGSAVVEASRMVVVMHVDDAAAEHAIGVVVATYEQRFAQESVLREREAVCVTF